MVVGLDGKGHAPVQDLEAQNGALLENPNEKDPYSHTQLDKLQRGLSIAQAVPVFGPLIVSPLKALVSKAQFVAGLAFYAYGKAMMAMGNNSEKMREFVKEGKHHMIEGAKSWLYAVANITTGGLAGLAIEIIRLPSTIVYFKDPENPGFIDQYIEPAVNKVKQHAPTVEYFLKPVVDPIKEKMDPYLDMAKEKMHQAQHLLNAGYDKFVHIFA